VAIPLIHNPQTWEYSPAYGLRSYAFVGVYGAVATAARFLYPHRAVLFYALRLAMATWSAGCEAALVRAVAAAADGMTAMLLLLFLGVAPGFFVASTSTHHPLAYISVCVRVSLSVCVCMRGTPLSGPSTLKIGMVTLAQPRRLCLSVLGLWVGGCTGLLPSSFCMPLVALAYAGWLWASHARRADHRERGLTQAIVCIGVAALLGWPFVGALGIPIAIDAVLVRGAWWQLVRVAALAGAGILVRHLYVCVYAWVYVIETSGSCSHTRQPTCVLLCVSLACSMYVWGRRS
jgi:hypothetical protein